VDDAVESVDGAQAHGERHADFALAFQDGRTAVDQQGETLTVRVAHLGNLVVTTGRIIACDPFWLDMAPEPYTTVVPCGQYPVLVSVISYADGDQRVACAMLRFTDSEAIRWEMALRPGQDLRTLAPGELSCYSVDAGTGCFADQAVVEALLAEAGIHDVDDWRIGPAGPHRTPDGDTTPEWRALVDSVYTWNEAFGDQLVEKLEATEYISTTVTVQVQAGTEGNLIAFSSGWGDGCYASFFGYDAHDNLVCLVTDFQVLLGVKWSGTAA
jgi:hypothetical protein